jgi:hypothetical protein
MCQWDGDRVWVALVVCIYMDREFLKVGRDFVRLRYGVGGYHSRLSPGRPGFESQYRNFFFSFFFSLLGCLFGFSFFSICMYYSLSLFGCFYLLGGRGESGQLLRFPGPRFGLVWFLHPHIDRMNITHIYAKILPCLLSCFAQYNIIYFFNPGPQITNKRTNKQLQARRARRKLRRGEDVSE